MKKVLPIIILLFVGLVGEGQGKYTPKFINSNRDTFGLWLAVELGFPEYENQRVLLQDKKGYSYLWRDSSGYLLKEDYPIYVGSITLPDAYDTTWGVVVREWPVFRADTVRCILLVSDSSAMNGFRSSRTFWQFGYEVWPPITTGYMLDREKDVLYLDEGKSPLKKNLVVWLSKEIK